MNPHQIPRAVVGSIPRMADFGGQLRPMVFSTARITSVWGDCPRVPALSPGSARGVLDRSEDGRAREHAQEASSIAAQAKTYRLEQRHAGWDRRPCNRVPGRVPVGGIALHSDRRAVVFLAGDHVDDLRPGHPWFVRFGLPDEASTAGTFGLLGALLCCLLVPSFIAIRTGERA